MPEPEPEPESGPAESEPVGPGAIELEVVELGVGELPDGGEGCGWGRLGRNRTGLGVVSGFVSGFISALVSGFTTGFISGTDGTVFCGASGCVVESVDDGTEGPGA